MILIRYCVILLPSNKFLNARALVIPVVASLLLSSIFTSRSRAYSFGLLYSSSVTLILGILLFMVMLAVVTIIDYSEGIIK